MRGPSEGGSHILRSTPVARRSDRHCKVQTSRGPRDRRMRLSANTAIQFYDLQDRLGYDRSSKAMEWLMTKAKNAIEKLYELPGSDNSNESVQTMPGSNSNPSSAPIDHLSLARGSETPTFYQPDNSHVVNNPATYFPGFSSEALPSPLGLPLYNLLSDNNEGNSDHHHHSTDLFEEEYYMDSKVGFLMSSQEICQQTGVYFQGVPLSNVAMDQQDYHPGDRQSWYIPSPFYNDEETEGQVLAENEKNGGL